MGDALPHVDFGSNYVVSIQIEFENRCAVLDNRQVRCWGLLGVFSQANVMLGTGVMVSQVSLTQGPRVCVLLGDGSIKCWGTPGFELGYGDTNVRFSAEWMGDNLPSIHFEAKVASVTVLRGGGSCVMLINGKLQCWGRNTIGQLFSGNTVSWTATAQSSPYLDLGTVTPACFRTNWDFTGEATPSAEQCAATCELGSGLDESSGTCVPCAVGTYSDTVVASVCTICPPNTYSTAVAATTASTCTACTDSTSPAGSSRETNCTCDRGYGRYP